MKRGLVIGVSVVAGAAALATVFGPDLVSAVRFEDALGRHFKDAQADAGAWPPVQDACAFCHGAGGRSKNAQYPSLAGQPGSYIEAQLHAFAEGGRPSPQMGSIARQLNEEQIKQLAAYFARQTPDRNQAPAADAALDGQGQAVITARSCASCHGDRLMGGPHAPRLAGQGEAYLGEQLTAFKEGRRKDPSQAMNQVAGSLSDGEVKAAAHYIAGLGATSAR